MNAFKEQTVLVTGALTGIGRATAKAFAHEGAWVVVSGRDLARGAELVKEIAAEGGQARFERADIREESEIARLVTAAAGWHGGLDIAINNAGTEGALGPVTGVTPEQFHDTFNTNVLGTLLAMKHEVAAMAPRGRGKIVNLSSVVGHVGMPGASIYAASKHAVEGLTKVAALEVAASGIQINAVAPGPVATAMLDRFTGHSTDVRAGLLSQMPAKRAATAEEIAATILFLASPGAAYVNGHIVAVDSGYSAA